MFHRSVRLTLPGTGYSNLYTLLTDAALLLVPEGYPFPKNVAYLAIQSLESNAAGVIARTHDPSFDGLYARAGDYFPTMSFDKNCIDLTKQYYRGDIADLVICVEVGAM